MAGLIQLNMIILNSLKKHQTSIFLFLFIFIAYVLITGGNFWEYDSFASYKLSKSIVDHRNFQISCFWGEKGADGKCYSKYGLFMSVAIIPFYLIEKIYLEIFKGNFFYPGFFPSLTNAAITALLSVLIYKYLLRFKFSGGISITGALLFSFFTFAASYTKTLFAEPLITLLIYLCFYVLLFFSSSRKKYALAGFIFGLGFLTKITIVIILPAILYLFCLDRKEWKKTLYFIFPFLFLFIVWCFYNFFRFGSFFDTGYRGIGFGENILKGIYLFILSPGKSLFFYQPFIIFFIFGIGKFFRKQKRVFVVFSLVALIHLFFYSAYSFQVGEWAWGPRFLYTTLPFFVLCVMFFLNHTKKFFIKAGFYVCLGLSLIIQLSSVYLSYHRYYSFMNKKYGYDFSRLIYPSFNYSPLLGQWKMILRFGYKSSDDTYWKEAFQEYPSFKTNYKVAPPDLFFLRSRKLILMIIAAGVIEFLLIKKIYDSL